MHLAFEQTVLHTALVCGCDETIPGLVVTWNRDAAEFVHLLDGVEVER